MIQVQIKLKLTTKQEAELERWLVHLTAIWNFAVRKIELNADNRIYFKKLDFKNLLADHGPKLGIPSHTIQGMLGVAHDAWSGCFKRMAGRPRLKGHRNRLQWIPFPDPVRPPTGNSIAIPGLGRTRFFKQPVPAGKIKCGRIVKRASGWYLCLFIDRQRAEIKTTHDGVIGIDPGFASLLTLSDGEQIDHPRELSMSAKRLAQAQRGGNKALVSRLCERVKNRRRDRNHKLSYRLVSENQLIAFSADRHRAIARRFSKSVSDSAHRQLRQMLSYKSKCRIDGSGVYVEVESRNSTKTCSACGALSGPAGLSGLKVRQWTCAQCGAEHDRDVNAAINTLIAGAGSAPERSARVA